MVGQSFTRAAALGREAAELAERHGWSDDPACGIACFVLAALLTWQGRLEEAERWLQSAERTVRAETQPAMSAATRFVREAFEMARNRDSAALAAFQAAELLARRLASPHYLIPRIRAFLLLALVRLGQTGQAGQYLAGLSDTDREHGEIRIAEAALRLAQDDPHAATVTLAPVLDGSARVVWHYELMHAYALEAIARDALGDSGAAHNALERALDLAEPDSQLLPFLLHPAPGLLDRHTRHHAAHAALVAEIRGLLSGTQPSPRARPQPLLAALSESEVRVLRYLPTNLTAPEIARELYVSPNTVKTHIKNLYAKLGTPPPGRGRRPRPRPPRPLQNGVGDPLSARTLPAGRTAVAIHRSGCLCIRPASVSPYQAATPLFRLAEVDHAVIELFVRHGWFGVRMCPLGPVGVEHEVEVTPPGVRRRGASGVDDPAVRPDEVDDVGQGDICTSLASRLGPSENVLDLLAHLVVDALGLLVGGEATGEEVVETAVSRLHGEQVLQVVDKPLPRIVYRQCPGCPVEELLDARSERGHEQVQARREVAVQGADRHAGLARDLLQGGIHAVRGELTLRRLYELAAALLRVAAQGTPHLLNVGPAHLSNVPGMSRAPSA